MEALLRAIVSELVEHPEEITISPKRSPRGTVLELRVHPNDTARIIGKQGRVINALRTIAKAAGTKDQERIYLHLITPFKKDGTPYEEHEQRGPRFGGGGGGRFRR
ncbi:MAG TPA: KH domain-containing protein [bacterium]|nr:KH domain-containing protein [bacterium]